MVDGDEDEERSDPDEPRDPPPLDDNEAEVNPQDGEAASDDEQDTSDDELAVEDESTAEEWFGSETDEDEPSASPEGDENSDGSNDEEFDDAFVGDSAASGLGAGASADDEPLSPPEEDDNEAEVNPPAREDDGDRYAGPEEDLPGTDAMESGGLDSERVERGDDLEPISDDLDPIGDAPAGGDEATAGAHALPGPTRPGLFDRDPAEIEAAVPADVPVDRGIPPTPSHGSEAGGAPATDAGDPGHGTGGEGGFGGAPDDQEMPLADHVEEMAMRLFVVVGVMSVVAVLTLPVSDELINFLWYSFLDGPAEACGQVAVDAQQGGAAAGPSGADCPHIYSPLALIFARLKVASLVGMIVALPVFVYQTYLFMRPGLYPRERRYYLAAVPTSLVLAAVGVAFAYFAVLRAMFDYFSVYSDRAADLAFGLGDTFSLMVLMLGFFALVFQIPLFVMLAIMMGVTTRRWLVERRLYFWGGFAAVAFVFSPDPTGMAPLMVAVTMIGLFEGTLLLLKWTGSSSPIPSIDDLTDRRPTIYALFALVGYVVSPLPVPTGYYGELPATVTDTLATVGLAPPILVGGGLIVLFELTAYVNKNYYGSVRLWRGLRRARLPLWAVAIVVGYLSSPDPALFRLVQQFSVEPTVAAAVAVGLVVLFEGTLALARWRSGDPDDDRDAEFEAET
ncbi:twin-arginine translocase subunit TatC [Haloarcula nitratireducens]|uniref:Sec-independent protein translocase protein TatC n=1 Tax=Haloarcula nitratireducens TaxID=2487749 RepID=A0AAW4PE12_9EURY|nr:twin-arginine translocase subunit TatC [Halomicroarcula nitratireducens]MBX0295848.1 twin-arginine translocase subunit TatC [Halomicroarcula nitratireducens]